MKKMIKRFKRALAGFLKEELLDYIGYNHDISFMGLNERVVVNNVPFQTMVMEKRISIDIQNPHELEKQIDLCRREFANRIMDHIHVDARELATREHFRQRSVLFTLRVQEKN